MADDTGDLLTVTLGTLVWAGSPAAARGQWPDEKVLESVSAYKRKVKLPPRSEEIPLT
jgi:hypothetical protein